MSTLHKLTKGLLNRHRVQRQLDAEQKASQRLRQTGSSPTGAGTSSSSPPKLKSALAAGKRDAAAVPKKTLSFALPTHEDPGAGAGGDELDDAAKAEAAELKALRREALDKLRMEQRRQREAKRAERRQERLTCRYCGARRQKRSSLRRGADQSLLQALPHC